jgi:multicomponent Na+:H+ antiporter subunit D
MTDLAVHLPALQVVVPLLAAPLVALLRGRNLAWSATVTASLIAFGLAIGTTATVLDHGPLHYAVGSWPAPYGIELIVDAFSSLLLLIVTGASSAVLMMSARSLGKEIEPERLHLFYCAWLLVLAGLSGILVAGDAFNIFVFMEISSLATYVLIAGGPHRAALTAVLKYLVMGTIGATFYLTGVGLVYMMTGTLNLADMRAQLADAPSTTPTLLASGFIVIGLALKAAVFPLHSWLPRAYTFAPHAVTAFIAACSTKVALYVLLRFDFVVFRGGLPGHELQLTAFLLPLAVLAILIASSIALAQTDVKRLLAYSSVAQVGYILVGASLGTVAGLTAGVLHMFNHALAKSGLFLAVVCLAFGGVRLSVEGMRGVARRMPVTMAAFLVAGLSLIGIPGTAGFISKWYLALSAFEHGFVGLWLIAPVLIGSLLAVAYVWRIIESAYFAPQEELIERREAPVWMLAVLWIVVLANLYFGFAPGLPLELAGAAAEGLLDVSKTK